MFSFSRDSTEVHACTSRHRKSQGRLFQRYLRRYDQENRRFAFDIVAVRLPYSDARSLAVCTLPGEAPPLALLPPRPAFNARFTKSRATHMNNNTCKLTQPNYGQDAWRSCRRAPFRSSRCEMMRRIVSGCHIKSPSTEEPCLSVLS